MKKILTLGEDYGGLRCYRMEQAGRLELLRVLNDQPPYWLVMIRNFNRSETGADHMALRGITTPWGNGVFRFLDEGQAYAKFQVLSQLPIFVAERRRVIEIRNKKRERMLGEQFTGYHFKKKSIAVKATLQGI